MKKLQMQSTQHYKKHSTLCNCITQIFVSEKNILGKEVTPFLLSRINEITGGESLRASMFILFITLL